MSREELVDLAVKEGFFADTETAAQACILCLSACCAAS